MSYRGHDLLESLSVDKEEGLRGSPSTGYLIISCTLKVLVFSKLISDDWMK